MSSVRRRRRHVRVSSVRPEVRALEPRRLLATFQVTSAADSGAGTLRDAIAQSNASGGADTITFAIGTGSRSIALASALPDITDLLTIDGSTQPGYAGKPIIEISGAGAGSNFSGLTLKAPATVKGLVINRFSGNGVLISGGSGSTVKNCYIGTNLAGNLAAANSGVGVSFEGGSSCTIGGSAEADRNILSGNGGEGVRFIFGNRSDNNLVQNNYIGLDATGSFKIPNGAAGVQFFAPATFNVIKDNVISGNVGVGVGVFGGDSTDLTIVGNRIGTNAAGTIAVGNTRGGIDSFGSDRMVVKDNILSGNGESGITLAGGDFIRITGNKIGVDITGQLPMGNGGEGIDIGKVGGDFNDVRIGGLNPGEGNIIANNGNAFSPPGIAVGSSARGVLILSNSIYNNNSLGIDLNWDRAVNPNDAGDADAGANGLQNFPVITAATAGGTSVTVSGSLNSAPSTTYTIQLFASSIADPTGYGEGQVFIGTFSLTTDSAGNATFTRTFAAAVNAGDKITATATAPTGFAGGGMTSEFARNFVSTPAPTTDVSVAIAGDQTITIGGSVTYSATVRNNGPGQAKDVALTFAIPAGATLVSASPANYTLSNNVLTFNFATINALLSSLAVIRVTPGNLGVNTATAAVTGSFLDSDNSNNTATFSTQVDDRPGAFSLVNPALTTVEAAGFVAVGVQRVGGSKGPATVTYAITPGTATPGADYNASATTGTLTFGDGDTFASVLIEILPDDVSEGDETISIALSNPTGGTSLGAGSSGTLTIVDNDPAPSVSVADVRVTEGDSGTATALFTFNLSAASGRTTSFQYATGGGNATAGADYLAASGTVTFAPGETSKTVAVTLLPDTLDEADETVKLNLSGAVGLALPASAPTLIIADDDPTPTLSIDDVTVREGTGSKVLATFTVTLSAPSGREVSVGYATLDRSAASGLDYDFASGTLTFAPGSLTRTVTVAVLGDNIQELNEAFAVVLVDPINASIDKAVGSGAIADDDPSPSISILNAAQVVEPDTGTNAPARFMVALSAQSAFPITVHVATADGTAAAGSDYLAASADLVFQPGETTRFFDVAVIGDRVHEGNEAFTVALSSPVNATLAAQSQGAATIVDNDPEIKVAIAGNRVTEGNSGTSDEVFTLTLSSPSELPVTVKVATSNGSALAGEDYVARSTTVTFAPGQRAATFAVPVVGDRRIEPLEAFAVTLSAPTNAVIAAGQGAAIGYIVDNDLSGVIQVDATRQAVAENVAGGYVNVTLIRAGGDVGAVAVPYATANGTALAGQDYNAASGTVTFADGQTRAVVRIRIINDTAVEPDEAFVLDLGKPGGGATLGAQKAQTIVIRNDDKLPPPPQLIRVTPKFTGQNLTGIELAFSAPLQGDAASTIANYALRGPGRDKVLGTADDSGVTISSASYNPTARTVTLGVQSTKLTTPLQLVVKSSGVLDPFKQALDGNRDGKPGGDAVATISRAGAGLLSLTRKRR